MHTFSYKAEYILYYILNLDHYSLPLKSLEESGLPRITAAELQKIVESLDQKVKKYSIYIQTVPISMFFGGFEENILIQKQA